MGAAMRLRAVLLFLPVVGAFLAGCRAVQGNRPDQQAGFASGNPDVSREHVHAEFLEKLFLGRTPRVVQQVQISEEIQDAVLQPFARTVLEGRWQELDGYIASTVFARNLNPTSKLALPGRANSQITFLAGSALQERRWPLPPATPMPAAEFVEMLKAYRGGFSELRRFFLKAQGYRILGDSSVSLRLGWQAEGTEMRGGEREDVGEAAATFSRAASGWHMDGLEIVSLESRVAERRYFAERSRELGLALPPDATDPAAHYGVAVRDVDGDGWEDIFVGGGDSARLFQNLKGKKFVDVTARWGLREDEPTITGLFFDADNDGDADLVTSHPGSIAVRFHENTGDKFHAPVILKEAEVESVPRGMVAADFDRDGRVDLFVCCDLRRGQAGISSTGAVPRGVRSWLFWNRPQGWVEGSLAAGLRDRRSSMSAVAQDLNNDGWPDLFVVNHLGTHNQCLINRKNGTFRDLAAPLGLLGSGSGMGTAAVDLGSDGLPDLYVANMYSVTARHHWSSSSGVRLSPAARDQNRLYVNRGFPGSPFDEIGEKLGIHDAGWAWSPAWLDVDLDGDLDLYVTNGNRSGVSEQDL